MTFHLGPSLRLIVALLIIALAPPGFSEIGRKRDVDLDAAPSRINRLIIKPKRLANLNQLRAFHAARGARVKRHFPALGDLQVIEVPAGTDAKALAEAYRRNPLVQYVEFDGKVHTFTTPNDTYFTNQWGLHNTGQSGGTNDVDIDAPEAWDIRSSASSVIVAVVDSGAKLNHEDLAANFWVNAAEIPGNNVDDDGNGYIDDVNGINAINGSGNPSDDNGHGTHVCGIIGAVGNNAKGVSGVAWQVQLMPLKFIDADGGGDISDALACLDYARSNGASIVSASWGGSYYFQSLYDAIEDLRDAGIIFVAAAGNDFNDNDFSFVYPAGYPLDNVVAVGAMTRSNTLAFFSSYGYLSVDLFAPGYEINSTFLPNTNSYAVLSGTSMATPHVSGAFALLAAQGAEPYRSRIYRLLGNVELAPAYRAKCQSGGALNLQKALQSFSQYPTNDSFATRITVTGPIITTFGRNVGASKESGEPNHAGNAGGHSVWWTWTAPFSGTFEVTTAKSITNNTTALDTLLAIYTGSAVNALSLIASNDNSNISDDGTTTSRLTFSATGGTAYQIAVDGYGGAEGFIKLAVHPVVNNDTFAAAHRLNGPYIAVDALNFGATKDSSEPSHGGNSGARSVWWSWIAPVSGKVTIATAGSDFDTTLAVYTGNGYPLTLIAENDDDGNADLKDDYGGKTSAVTFNATNGQTYRIAVDGKNGAYGYIKLAGGYEYSINAVTNVGGTAYRVNSANQASGTSSSQAYRYDIESGAVTWVGTLGGSVSTGRGLNDTGSIAGESSVDEFSSSVAYIWDAVNGIRRLGPSASQSASIAFGLNAWEVAVGTIWDQTCGASISYSRACYWINTNVYFLPTFGGTNSTGYDINSSNEIAGAAYLYRTNCSFGTNHAALWTIGPSGVSLTDLGTLGGSSSRAVSINEGGEMIGNSSLVGGGKSHPTLWRDERAFDLSAFGPGGLSAKRHNNRGQVVGLLLTTKSVNGDDFGFRPFLWQNDTFIDLNRLVPAPPVSPPGGTKYFRFLRSAEGINDAGYIVGDGQMIEEGWFMRLIVSFFLKPVPTIRLENELLTSTNTFKFDVFGPTGLVCTVEATSDLLTSWTNIGSVTLTGGTAQFIDGAPSSISNRFYRVISGNVRSADAVGYLIKSVPAGLSMVSQPFDCQDNRIPAVFPDRPLGLTVYKFDERTQNWRLNTYDDLDEVWNNYQMTFNPGESLTLSSPTNFVWKCFGKIKQNSVRQVLNAQYSTRGPTIPVAGALDTALNFPPYQGDVILRMTNTAGDYATFTYTNGAWTPGTPSIALGEGFFAQKAEAAVWRQNYSVW